MTKNEYDYEFSGDALTAGLNMARQAPLTTLFALGTAAPIMAGFVAGNAVKQRVQNFVAAGGVRSLRQAATNRVSRRVGRILARLQP